LKFGSIGPKTLASQRAHGPVVMRDASVSLKAIPRGPP
jgi:hypothetical protein